MNKKQIKVLILAGLISIVSIMVTPTIFWEPTRDMEKIKIQKQIKARNLRIHCLYIPAISFVVAGIFAYRFRNKDNKH